MNDESQWGYINMDGEVIIECKCDSESNLYGIMDKNYEWACEPQYLWLSVIWEPFTNNLIKVDGVDGGYILTAGCSLQDVGYGGQIINVYGNVAVPMKYTFIDSETGMNRITVNNYEGYCGAIDLNGELQIQCQYDDWRICAEGSYIAVSTETEDTSFNISTLFDINGNIIRTFENGIYNVGAFQRVFRTEKTKSLYEQE